MDIFFLVGEGRREGGEGEGKVGRESWVKGWREGWMEGRREGGRREGVEQWSRPLCPPARPECDGDPPPSSLAEFMCALERPRCNMI